jgi:hypothetical protein
MFASILSLPRLDGAGQARKALVRKEVDRCFKEGMEGKPMGQGSGFFLN